MSETTHQKAGRELLSEFLATHKITQQAAAVALGRSRTLVNLWLQGHMVPGIDNRKRIQTWTKDFVPFDAWDVGRDLEVKPFDETESEPTVEKEAS